MTETYRRLWPADGHIDTAQFAVIGRSGGAQVLLPLDRPSATAEALVRHHAGMRPTERVVRKIASATARIGLLKPMLRRRISVPRSGPAGQPSLHGELEAILGRAPLALSVAFGPPRPNRKPVVRAIDSEGQTVGFAKIGWDTMTRSLVESEAEVLGGPMARRLATVAAPKLIALTNWAGFRMAVYAPLVAVPGRPRPDSEAFREVAAAWPTSREQLGTSDLTRKLADWPDDSEADLGRQVLASAIERFGDIEMQFGGWHGDWTPWNSAASSDGRIIVWDWERAGPGHPLWFDFVHYYCQPRFLSSRYSIAGLITEISATPLRNQLSDREITALVIWYLLTISRRHAGHPRLSHLRQTLDLLTK